MQLRQILLTIGSDFYQGELPVNERFSLLLNIVIIILMFGVWLPFLIAINPFMNCYALCRRQGTPDHPVGWVVALMDIIVVTYAVAMPVLYLFGTISLNPWLAILIFFGWSIAAMILYSTWYRRNSHV